MDERHWWFVNRIQETFNFGTEDSPTIFEDFLSDASNINTINRFLEYSNTYFLIFYETFLNEVKDEVIPRILSVVNELNNDFGTYNGVSLCFIRPVDLDYELDLLSLEENIFSMEIDLNSLSGLIGLISEFYVPMINQSTISTSIENNHEFAQKKFEREARFETIIENLTVIATESDDASILKLPFPDFIKALSISPVRYTPLCNLIVQNWVVLIQSYLTDAHEEPILEIEEQYSLMKDLRNWRSKFHLLTLILRQLHTQPVKTVISHVSSSHSEINLKIHQLEVQLSNSIQLYSHRITFLEVLSKKWSAVFSSSDILSLRNSISSLNSDMKLDIWPSQLKASNYFSYILFKIIWRVTHMCAYFVSNEINSSNLNITNYLKMKFSEDSYKFSKYFEAIDIVYSIFNELKIHLDLLKPHGFLRSLGTGYKSNIGIKNSSSSVTSIGDQSVTYAEFNSTSMLLSPIENYCNHMQAFCKLSKRIYDFNHFADRIQNLCPFKEVFKVPNPLCDLSEILPIPGAESSSATYRTAADNDSQLNIVLHVDNSDLRSRRLIGSGKMGTLLEIDEEVHHDAIQKNVTKLRPLQNVPIKTLKEVNENECIVKYYLRTMINKWIEEVFRHCLNNYDKGGLFLFSPFQINYTVYDCMASAIYESLNILESNIIFSLSSMIESDLFYISDLSILDALKSFSTDQRMNNILTLSLTKMSIDFASKLVSLKARYHENVFTPSKLEDLSNLSTIVRSIFNYIEKIQSAIDQFRSIQWLSSRNETKVIILDYENFMLELSDRKKEWVQYLCQCVEEMTLQLNNRILHFGEVIEVNLNRYQFVAIRQIKALLKLKIDLPSKVVKLLSQEDDLKYKYERLQGLLQGFYEAKDSLSTPFMSLFIVHYIQYFTVLQSGLRHLTWNSSNIDIYLSSADSGLCLLQERIKSLNKIISSTQSDFTTALHKIPDFFGNKLPNSASIEVLNSRIHKKTSRYSTTISRLINTMNINLYKCILIASCKEDLSIIISLSSEDILTKFDSISSQMSTVESVQSVLQYYNDWRDELLYKLLLQNLNRLCSLFSFTLNNQAFKLLETNLAEYSKDMPNTGLPSILHLHLLTGKNFNFVNLKEDFGRSLLTLQCECAFTLPRLMTQPNYFDIIQDLSDLYDVIGNACPIMYNVLRSNDNEHKVYRESIHNKKATFIQNLENISFGMQQTFELLSKFTPLWLADINDCFEHYMNLHPTHKQLEGIVCSMVDIEKFVENIPQFIYIGILEINFEPLKYSLSQISHMWKTKFGSIMLKGGQIALYESVKKRDDLLNLLDTTVDNLSQLNITLNRIQFIQDLEMISDSECLEIEHMYNLMDSYGIPLIISDIYAIRQLRPKWQEVINLAKSMVTVIMKDKRKRYENDIKMAVETFEVKTLEIYKAFDAEGPCVIGITPQFAMECLNKFELKHKEANEESQLYHSLQEMFNLPITRFESLEKLEQGIYTFSKLYDLFDTCIAFESEFNDHLWNSLDLDKYNANLQNIIQRFAALDTTLQNWQAYKEISGIIQRYNLLFPILKCLLKPSIKHRHWLKLMILSNVHYQLDSNKLKVNQVLQIPLHNYAIEIEEIYLHSQREAEVEKKLTLIEEEWKDRVFSFSNDTPSLFDGHIAEILTTIEAHQIDLMNILSSQYSHVFREHTILWSTKLEQVQEMVSLIKYIQLLIQQLNVAFSKSNSLHNQIFSDKYFICYCKWKKLVKNIESSPSIITSCCSGEYLNDKLPLLCQELEQCKLEFTEFYQKLRDSCPHFYFLTDEQLLELCYNVSIGSSILHYFKYFCAGLSKFLFDNLNEDEIQANYYSDNDFNSQPKLVTGVVTNSNDMLLFYKSISYGGDPGNLVDRVLNEISSSLENRFISLVNKNKNNSYDILYDWDSYPIQTCISYIHLFWTRNIEVAIVDSRSHKNALSNTIQTFYTTVVTKLQQQFVTNTSDVITTSKLECLLLFSLWLRELNEDLMQEKVLKDVSAFEWQKLCRMYTSDQLEDNSQQSSISEQPFDLILKCLYTDIPYGFQYIEQFGPMLYLCCNLKCLHYLYQCVFERRFLHFNTISPNSAQDFANALSHLHGKHFYNIILNQNTLPAAIERTLTGVIRTESWCQFTYIDSLNSDVLLYMSLVLSRIHKEIYTQSGTDELIKLRSFVIITSGTNYILQPQYRSTFRHCHFMFPNENHLITIYSSLRGLKISKHIIEKSIWFVHILPKLFPDLPQIIISAKFLVNILRTLYTIKLKQKTTYLEVTTEIDILRPRPIKKLSTECRDISNKVARPTSNTDNIAKTISNSTPSFVKDQLQALGGLIVDALLPRLPDNLRSKFLELISEVFGVISHTEDGQLRNILTTIRMVTKQLNIDPTPLLINKVKDLYSITQNTNLLMLLGPISSGKTTCFNTFISVLNNTTGDVTTNRLLSYSVHKIINLLPKALPLQTPNNAHTEVNAYESVLESIINKAKQKSNEFYWIVCDDIFNIRDLEYLLTVSHSGYIWLRNGDKLFIPTNIKIVLETIDISSFAPSLMNELQCVYFARRSVKFSSLANIWLASQNKDYYKCLNKLLQDIPIAFIDRYMCDYTLFNICNEVQLYSTFFVYFDSILNRFLVNPERFSESKVERLVIFSFIWSFGRYLDDKEKLRFSRHLLSLSKNIPDLDSKTFVFDFYVDEYGDWDKWSTALRDIQATYNVTCDGDIYVRTDELDVASFFLELSSDKSPIMLIGPPASGKTSLLKNFLYGRTFSDPEHTILHYPLNGMETSSTLYDSLMSQLERHYMSTYGPMHGKEFSCFIDDFHAFNYSNQASSPLELVRSILEYSGCFSKNQPEWIHFTNCTFFAAITSYNLKEWMQSRLSRHFVTICVPAQTFNEETIFNLLTASTQPEGMRNCNETMVKNIVNFSRELIQIVSMVFQPTILHGRSHFYFSLKQLSLIFHSLRLCPDELFENSEDVFKIHYATNFKVFSSCFANSSDLNVFENILNRLSKKYEFPSECSPFYFSLIGSSGDFKSAYLNIHTEYSHVLKSATSSAINVCNDVKSIIQTALKMQHQHNERYTEYQCTTPLTLSDTEHIDYLCLILSQPKSNILFVGSTESKLIEIARLSYFASGFTYFPMATDTYQTYLDSLKSAIRLATLESQALGLILDSSDLSKEYVARLTNIFIVSGHLDSFFKQEEMLSLIQSIEPSYKKSLSLSYTDPRQFFSVQIQKYLKIIICLDIRDELWTGTGVNTYPGYLKSCSVVIYQDWNVNKLTSDLTELSNRSSTSSGIFDKSILTPDTVEMCSKIHTSFQKSDTFLNKIEETSKFYASASSALIKSISLDQKNLSQQFFSELDIITKNIEKSSSASQRFTVSSSFYLKFMATYIAICSLQKEKSENEKEILKSCLQVLRDARNKYKGISKEITELLQRKQLKEIEFESILIQLSSTSSQIEIIKAYTVKGEYNNLRSTISAIEKQDIEDGRKIDFLDDLHLIKDLLENQSNMNQMNVEKRIKETLQQIDDLKSTILQSEKQVELTKKNVQLAFEKIDRNTIEQIRTLNTPAIPIIIVMEIVVQIVKKQQIKISPPHSILSRQGPESVHPGLSADSCAIIPESISPVRNPHRSLLRQSTSLKDNWSFILKAIPDSQKFLDQLKYINCDEIGLDHEIVELIEKHLVGSQTNIPEHQSTSLITYEHAKHASGSIGVIYNYVITLANYHYAIIEMQKLDNEMQSLQCFVEGKDSTLTAQKPLEFPKLNNVENYPDLRIFVNEDQLKEHESNLIEIQNKYSCIVEEMDNIDKSICKLNADSESIKSLLTDISLLEHKWEEKFKELSYEKLLLSLSLTASICLCYFGALSPEQRVLKLDEMVNLINLDKLAEFIDLSPILDITLSFISKLFNFSFTITSIPSLNNTQLNLYIIFNPYIMAWPLILDPFDLFLTWSRQDRPSLIKIQFNSPSMLNKLKECCTKGQELAIIDIDIQSLMRTPEIIEVLKYKCKKETIAMSNFVKVAIKEPIHPNFRLYLVYHDETIAIPHFLTQYVTIVYFTEDRSGFGENLGYTCIATFDSSQYEELKSIQNNLLQSQTLYSENETMLMSELKTASIEFNLDSFTKFQQLTTKYLENYHQAKSLELKLNSIKQKNSNYFNCGAVAAIIFEELCNLKFVNCFYSITFQQFKEFLLKIGSKFSKRQEQNDIHAIINRCYDFYSKALKESDRYFFGFMLAIQNEFLKKKITSAETDTLYASLSQSSNTYKSLLKKPFDWMLESQWQNLQQIGRDVPVLERIVNNMAKDGHATQWRTICESETVVVDIPEDICSKLTPFQKLLLLKCLQPNMFFNVLQEFINKSIGVDLSRNSLFNSSFIVDFVKPKFPIIMAANHPSNALITAEYFAKLNNTHLTIISLQGSMHDDIQHILTCITDTAIAGNWILLENTDLNIKLLDELELHLESIENYSNTFRLLISLNSLTALPATLIKRSIKYFLGSPYDPRQLLVRAIEFSNHSGMLAKNDIPEWLPFVHNMSLFHAACRVRSIVSNFSSNSTYRWSILILFRSLKIISQEFLLCKSVKLALSNQFKPFSWTGIKYIISELVYGSIMTCQEDQDILNGIIDIWLQPYTIKQTYEFPRLHYQIPPPFFFPSSKPVQLTNSIQNYSSNPLQSMEICGLYDSQLASLFNSKALFDTLELIPNSNKSIKSYNESIQSSQMSTAMSKLEPGRSKMKTVTRRGTIDIANTVKKKIGDSTTTVKNSFSKQSSIIFNMTPIIFPKNLQDKTLMERYTAIHTAFHKQQESISFLMDKCTIIENTRLKQFYLTEINQWKECFQSIEVDLEQVATYFSSKMHLSLDKDLYNIIKEINEIRAPQKWVNLFRFECSGNLESWLQLITKNYNYLKETISKQIMPSYQLGSFFFPQTLLTILCVLSEMCDIEKTILIGEISNKERYYVRDPPKTGIYVSDVFVSGCHWEKTVDFCDFPPRTPSIQLPLLHVVRGSASQLLPRKDTRGPYVYYCPVHTLDGTNHVLFYLKVQHPDINRTKWILRRLKCSLSS